MTSTAPTRPARTRLAKGERENVLVRFPKGVLPALDAKASAANLSRNDAVIAAVEAWNGQPPSYADLKAPPAPKPKLGKNAARIVQGLTEAADIATGRAELPPQTPRSVPGSRLDKSSIGKRVGPKKGSKEARVPAPAAEEEEAV